MITLNLINIEQVVQDFCLNSLLNEIEELDHLRLFDKPLVGVAEAQDSLFDCLKAENIVGPQHMSPHQWLAGGKSVISYFLPFTKKVREANRSSGFPAQEWLYGRIEGELFNKALCQFLEGWFIGKGYEAISPVVDVRFKVVNRRSNWSERHVAYVAGLGTFSLNCSLITKSGSAGRLGSVIVSAPMEPTLRYYTTKDENCTKCGACIMRCPPQAISKKGKDHAICSDYLDSVLVRFHPRYGCGKCQTGVPCEEKIPGAMGKGFF